MIGLVCQVSGVLIPAREQMRRREEEELFVAGVKCNNSGGGHDSLLLHKGPVCKLWLDCEFCLMKAHDTAYNYINKSA